MNYDKSFIIQSAKDCKQGDLVVFEFRGSRYIAIIGENYDKVIEIIILGIYNNNIFSEYDKSFSCADIPPRTKVLSYSDKWTISINSTDVSLVTNFDKGNLLLKNDKVFISCIDPEFHGGDKNFDLMESKFSILDADGYASARTWNIQVKLGDDWRVIFSAMKDLA